MENNVQTFVVNYRKKSNKSKCATSFYKVIAADESEAVIKAKERFKQDFGTNLKLIGSFEFYATFKTPIPPRTYVRVGDKVEVIGNIPFALKDAPRPIVGRVTRIDGSYILVKPRYRRWEAEFYPGELKLLHK